MGVDVTVWIEKDDEIANDPGDTEKRGAYSRPIVSFRRIGGDHNFCILAFVDTLPALRRWRDAFTHAICQIEEQVAKDHDAANEIEMDRCHDEGLEMQTFPLSALRPSSAIIGHMVSRPNL